ncbi:MAG: FtsQ-type POTRA domain-containing protein [Oscillospiraceae bacterium]|nr:FtsQ-type POTRA domain-containing protein [Oscillospiraceae bacterium]
METTQKNREAQTARRPRQNPAEAAPPPSAQQSNGAVRSAQEQRAAAGIPKQPESTEAPAKKKAAAKQAPVKKAPEKKAAPKKKAPAKKTEEKDVPERKRSYGNSKPKKSKLTLVKQRVRRKEEEKDGKPSRPKQPTPAVIYTQPVAFNRNRLLIQLATVVAIVLAMVLGVSVFFKVEHITVSGAQVYDVSKIKTACGLTEGEDSLLTFSRPRAAAMIKANLPYVDTVRFGIKLPDTVNIIVKEDQVVYSVQDQEENWWLISSEGRVVEAADRSKASNHTQITGVYLDSPVPDERCVALELVSEEVYGTGEETQPVPITVTGAQKLTSVLQILKALEANGVVGDIASVDVTRLEDIILWYGSRYQVNLGDSSNIDYKITSMNNVILDMSEWQSGILDVSYTIWPDKVIFTPFS